MGTDVRSHEYARPQVGIDVAAGYRGRAARKHLQGSSDGDSHIAIGAQSLAAIKSMREGENDTGRPAPALPFGTRVI